jgi:AbrB family looped-hinge helix DNA binding protein
VGWGVGMGEKVKIDSRWRIVIPSEFRKGLKTNDELIVEERGSEIILRKTSNEDIMKRFDKIKLFVNEKLRKREAESGKHRYRGYKE